MTLKECIEKKFKKFTRPCYAQYKGYCFINQDDMIQYIDKDTINTDNNYITFFQDILADDWYEVKTKIKKEGYVILRNNGLGMPFVEPKVYTDENCSEADKNWCKVIKIEWEEEE